MFSFFFRVRLREQIAAVRFSIVLNGETGWLVECETPFSCDAESCSSSLERIKEIGILQLGATLVVVWDPASLTDRAKFMTLPAADS